MASGPPALFLGWGFCEQGLGVRRGPMHTLEHVCMYVSIYLSIHLSIFLSIFLNICTWVNVDIQNGVRSARWKRAPDSRNGERGHFLTYPSNVAKCPSRSVIKKRWVTNQWITQSRWVTESLSDFISTFRTSRARTCEKPVHWQVQPSMIVITHLLSPLPRCVLKLC